MKALYIFSVALAIGSNVFYHIAQKMTPTGVNPAISLTISYLVATAGSLCLLVFYPLKLPLIESIKQVNWASILLGITIIGLELGFLLAYRAGWNINLAALVANTGVALLIIPVGLVIFREKLSAVNLIGVVLTVIGLYLINRK